MPTTETLARQEQPQYLTIAETAAYWGVSAHFVRACITRGDLAAHRRGRVIRIRRADCEALFTVDEPATR